MSKNTKIVNELFKKPKRDKGDNVPKFLKYLPDEVQQADLLFLPNDGGYKYALVVVDLGSNLTDAEPLKIKSSERVLDAFIKIYKKGILKIPKKIEVDSGTEFKGSVGKWFENRGVVVRVAKPYRHRQQAMVERKNQIIGTALFKRMTEQEILTDHPSVEWTDDINSVIKNLNIKQKKKKIIKPTNEYQCSGDACIIIPEETKVRVALDAPIDVVSGKRLHGRFRDSDIRFEIKPRVVKQVIIQPNQPPMYLVSNNKGENDHQQAYTKNQLLPVKSNEIQPDSSVIRPIKGPKGEKLYVVDDIIGKRKQNNRIQYHVKWAGLPSSLEGRASLVNNVPDLLKEYDKRALLN
jgi:hypothetical protein